MIVASQWGWHTVSANPPQFYDLLLMAQLMSEERVGSRVRHSRGTTQAIESDRAARLRKFTPE